MPLGFPVPAPQHLPTGSHEDPFPGLPTFALGVPEEVASYGSALTEAAQDSGPGVVGGGQVGADDGPQGGVVSGQDVQPQGLAVHQGALARAHPAAAPSST